jgi:hypothetical protein
MPRQVRLIVSGLSCHIVLGVPYLKRRFWMLFLDRLIIKINELIVLDN